MDRFHYTVAVNVIVNKLDVILSEKKKSPELIKKFKQMMREIGIPDDAYILIFEGRMQPLPLILDRTKGK